MQILFMILLGAYNFTILLYFKKHFPDKRKHWVFYIIAIAIYLICNLVVDLFDLHLIGIFVPMLCFMLELKLLFKMDLLRILHGGSAHNLILFSSRGIVVSVFSISMQQSVNDVLQQDNYFYLIASIAALIAIGYVQLTRKFIAPDNKTMPSLPHNSQMKIVVIYQFAILVYIFIINNGRLLDTNALWFSILYLVSFLITIGLLSFIWYASIQITGLQQYEMYTIRLQEQLERQVQHYRSYKKFTESYRTFKHDYNNMMSAVKILLKNNENEKAVNLLDQIHDTMQKNVQMHKTYSDNVLLDAILHDAANTCDEHNIKFSSFIHMPGITLLSDLEVVRVATNVLNNAIEACDKVINVSERFIKISGSINADWSYIEVSNSFSGELKYRDGELVTTKKNKDYHGFGLMNIKQIIEGIGGMVLTDVDQENRIFTLKLHIPRT